MSHYNFKDTTMDTYIREMIETINRLKETVNENSEQELTSIVSPPFTEEDLNACWPHYKSYLIDILNGEYKVEDAREDLRGLIGSEWDHRLPR